LGIAAALITLAMPNQQIARTSWSKAMRDLFYQARFSAAGDIYDDAVDSGAMPSSDDDLLRARIFLKSDENKAVAFLIRRPPHARSGVQVGRWALLLGIGYARMRDFERGDHHFAMARRYLTSSKDKAELAYHVARRWLLEGNTDEALRLSGDMSVDQSRSTKIALEVLRSFILSQEERYAEQAQTLSSAIRMIGDRRDEHLEQWFHAVQNLATLGRELSSPETAALAREEVDLDIEWPLDFHLQRFQALKAVGWSCALRGDVLGCFRYLRAAERVVPSTAFETILLLDRAYFARIMDESHWAHDEVAKAESIAEQVDWNVLAGDERVGLLLLAQATAAANPERGRFYLARYKGLDKIRSPLRLFAFDHRIEGLASYTEGVVRLAGNDPTAEESLRKAWTIFDRIGYDWRAGQTALKLREATKKERWRHLAEDKLEPFPQSWLAREVHNADGATKAPRVALPRMQNKVFTLLCQKRTTAQIAEELGLSQHTVRNHLKAVFRAYGVNNRAALIAEAASRGDLRGWSRQKT
jgi:DNA-binding CsgD family transcriptional regulator